MSPFDPRARDFVDVAFTMLKADSRGDAMLQLAQHEDFGIRQFAKAAANTLDGWGDAGGAEMAAAYLASIAEQSLLDQIARYARGIPVGVMHVLVASGYSADVTQEGDPMVVKHLGLNGADPDAIKSASIVVLSQELADATGEAGLRLFERELRQSVTRASNAAVLERLTNSSASTTAVTATGTAIGDLRAGLRAAGPSEGYVVAAGAGAVAELATHEANLGAGVRGGEFAPGISLVAIDDATEMSIIPASRLALRDYGLKVRVGGHCSIAMADTPSSPSELVSMFQTSSRALLSEREFTLMSDEATVVIVS